MGPKIMPGVYLGHSPYHSGNLVLLLNLITRHINHQYRAVFDDEFSTFSYLESDTAPPNLKLIFETLRKDVIDEEYKLSQMGFASYHSKRDSDDFQQILIDRSKWWPGRMVKGRTTSLRLKYLTRTSIQRENTTRSRHQAV